MKITKLTNNRKSYVTDKSRTGYINNKEVPSIITLRQFKLVLSNIQHVSGKSLLLYVNDFIESIPDEATRIPALVEWRYANTVDRNNPILVSITNMLGITSEELDQFFITGSKL